MLEEFPPVFDPSAEVADVNEVERIRGKCPGVFGVVDLEGNIWRHPFQSVIPCPRKIVYPERTKKEKPGNRKNLPARLYGANVCPNHLRRRIRSTHPIR